MSILLYNFKELTKSIEEIERIEARVSNSKKKEGLTKKEEEEKQEEQEEVPTTLDGYFFKKNR
jgi:ribosomal protein S2